MVSLDCPDEVENEEYLDFNMIKDKIPAFYGDEIRDLIEMLLDED